MSETNENPIPPQASLYPELSSEDRVSLYSLLDKIPNSRSPQKNVAAIAALGRGALPRLADSLKEASFRSDKERFFTARAINSLATPLDSQLLLEGVNYTVLKANAGFTEIDQALKRAVYALRVADPDNANRYIRELDTVVAELDPILFSDQVPEENKKLAASTLALAGTTRAKDIIRRYIATLTPEQKQDQAVLLRGLLGEPIVAVVREQLKRYDPAAGEVRANASDLIAELLPPEIKVPRIESIPSEPEQQEFTPEDEQAVNALLAESPRSVQERVLNVGEIVSYGRGVLPLLGRRLKGNPSKEETLRICQVIDYWVEPLDYAFTLEAIKDVVKVPLGVLETNDGFVQLDRALKRSIYALRVDDPQDPRLDDISAKIEEYLLSPNVPPRNKEYLASTVAMTGAAAGKSVIEIFLRENPAERGQQDSLNALLEDVTQAVRFGYLTQYKFGIGISAAVEPATLQEQLRRQELSGDIIQPETSSDEGESLDDLSPQESDTIIRSLQGANYTGAEAVDEGVRRFNLAVIAKTYGRRALPLLERVTAGRAQSQEEVSNAAKVIDGLATIDDFPLVLRCLNNDEIATQETPGFQVLSQALIRSIYAIRIANPDDPRLRTIANIGGQIIDGEIPERNKSLLARALALTGTEPGILAVRRYFDEKALRREVQGPLFDRFFRDPLTREVANYLRQYDFNTGESQRVERNALTTPQATETEQPTQPESAERIEALKEVFGLMKAALKSPDAIEIEYNPPLDGRQRFVSFARRGRITGAQVAVVSFYQPGPRAREAGEKAQLYLKYLGDDKTVARYTYVTFQDDENEPVRARSFVARSDINALNDIFAEPRDLESEELRERLNGRDSNPEDLRDVIEIFGSPQPIQDRARGYATDLARRKGARYTKGGEAFKTSLEPTVVSDRTPTVTLPPQPSALPRRFERPVNLGPTLSMQEGFGEKESFTPQEETIIPQIPAEITNEPKNKKSGRRRGIGQGVRTVAFAATAALGTLFASPARESIQLPPPIASVPGNQSRERIETVPPTPTPSRTERLPEIVQRQQRPPLETERINTPTILPDRDRQPSFVQVPPSPSETRPPAQFSPNPIDNLPSQRTIPPERRVTPTMPVPSPSSRSDIPDRSFSPNEIENTFRRTASETPVTPTRPPVRATETPVRILPPDRPNPVATPEQRPPKVINVTEPNNGSEEA